MKKLSKILSLVLVLVLCLAMYPASASAESYVNKLIVVTYRSAQWESQGYNTDPYGFDYVSEFHAARSTRSYTDSGNFTVTGTSVSPATERFENRQYTITISVAVSDPANYMFNPDGVEVVLNNASATFVPSSDYKSGTITYTVTPKAVYPTVWHDPADETHKSGETFSFAVTADSVATDFQWYFHDIDGSEMLLENLGQRYSGVTVDIAPITSGSRVNINNVPTQLDGTTVYCLVSNLYGSTKSASALINVSDAAYLNIVDPAAEAEKTSSDGSELDSAETDAADGIIVVEEDWSEDWSYDESSHWHSSLIPNVTDVSEKAEHTVSDWTVTVEPTELANGLETGTCSVCGAEVERQVEYVAPAEDDADSAGDADAVSPEADTLSDKSATSSGLPKALRIALIALAGLVGLAALAWLVIMLVSKRQASERKPQSTVRSGAAAGRSAAARQSASSAARSTSAHSASAAAHSGTASAHTGGAHAGGAHVKK